MKKDRIKLIYKKCSSEITTRTNEIQHLLLGEGNFDAKVMVIAEVPTAKEEEFQQNILEHDRDSLEKILKPMGLNKEDAYYTHLMKYRPYRVNKQGRIVSRQPDQEELAFFVPYLKQEIAVINPKLIIALGEIPLKWIAGDLSLTLNTKEDQIFVINVEGKNYKIYPIYHPSSKKYEDSLTKFYEDDHLRLTKIVKGQTDIGFIPSGKESGIKQNAVQENITTNDIIKANIKEQNTTQESEGIANKGISLQKEVTQNVKKQYEKGIHTFLKNSYEKGNPKKDIYSFEDYQVNKEVQAVAQQFLNKNSENIDDDKEYEHKRKQESIQQDSLWQKEEEKKKHQQLKELHQVNQQPGQEMDQQLVSKQEMKQLTEQEMKQKLEHQEKQRVYEKIDVSEHVKEEKISIVYAGEGYIDDPTLPVLDRISEVFSDLNISIYRVDLYKEVYSLTEILQLLSSSKGVVLATTVEWLGVGHRMQKFLDESFLKGHDKIFDNIPLFGVVVARNANERSAYEHLLTSWEYLGGKEGENIVTYFKNAAIVETNFTYMQIVEKKAESYYRLLQQQSQNLPSSTRESKVVIEIPVAVKTREPDVEQLKRQLYWENITENQEQTSSINQPINEVDDYNQFVEKQKEDIQSLSSLFKEKLSTTKTKMNQQVPERLKECFIRSEKNINIQFEFQDAHRDNTFIEIFQNRINAYYGTSESVNVKIIGDKEVFQKVLYGKLTMQRAFMTGEVKAKGDFTILYKFEEMFNFTK